MIMYIVKKYAVSQLNGLLRKYKDNVDYIRLILNKWGIRLEKILRVLRELDRKLEDNEVSSEEIDETVKDFEELVKEW